jgi:DNA-binding NarL/FixJ family response regulator
MAATILIVDDHAPMRTLIQGIVAQAPDLHVVGEAADVAEAIRLTHELQPDLVLLDLAMPRVNGLEALRRIKAARPATQVIIVTVHAEDAYRRAAEDSGADAVLVKKTLMTVLLPTIRRLRCSMSPPPPLLEWPLDGQAAAGGPAADHARLADYAEISSRKFHLRLQD